MQNERSLQAACLKHARSLGVWGRKVETPAYRGFPDCMFLYGSRVLFVEFKHPNGTGRVSPLQAVDHVRLNDVGHGVEIIDDIENFQTLIHNFMEQPK